MASVPVASIWWMGLKRPPNSPVCGPLRSSGMPSANTFPVRMRLAALTMSSGWTWLSVPTWSSLPQRPQFLSFSGASAIALRPTLMSIVVSRLPSWRLYDAAHPPQDDFRGHGYFGEGPRAQRAQRVVDGIHHRGGRAGGAGLACALGTELGIGRRRHHMADLDVGHLGRHGHQIVGHVAVEELAAVVVAAVLEQRRADALHDAAADLLVDQLRVDDRAAILHTPVLQERDEPAVWVGTHPGGLDAVGEGEGPGARHVVARRHQLGLEAGRQRVRTEIGDARDLIEADALGAGGGVDHHAAADVQRLRLGLEDRARHRQH